MNIKELGIQHVAIIMDGNGRWATEKNLDRTAGHAAGEHALSKAIYWALENNLSWLTVYAFSTENWTRSTEEVDFLLILLNQVLKQQNLPLLLNFLVSSILHQNHLMVKN